MANFTALIVDAGGIRQLTTGDVLTVPALQVGDLTSGRIPYVTTSGRLVDSQYMYWVDNCRPVFERGARFGYSYTTPVMGARISSFWIPRRCDFDFFCDRDYMDELFCADKRASCSISPAPSSGAFLNIFRDNSDCAIWNSGTSPSPIVIEMDFSSNPLLHNNAAAWNLGTTTRFGSPILHVKIEAASSSGIYATMYDADISLDTGGVWLSPSWYPVSPYHIYKLKVTLTVATPLPSDFRLQRLLLYHIAPITFDPWHLHITGGTIYGNVILSGAALRSAANEDLTLTPASGKNIKLSNLKYPNTDGSSGNVLKTDGAGNLSWAPTVPAPPVVDGQYKLVVSGGVASWVTI